MTDSDTTKLVRTSVLLPESVDEQLRKLAAEGNRPIAREIRAAIEAHLANAKGAA